MLVRCPVGTPDVHHSAKSLTSDSDRVVILGLSDCFGIVIIFVSPIAVVVLCLSGDQIVPMRFPEWRKVLRGSPALALGVCAKGVPSPLLPLSICEPEVPSTCWLPSPPLYPCLLVSV